MKARFHRFTQSRSFATLLSIVSMSLFAVLALAFSNAEADCFFDPFCWDTVGGTDSAGFFGSGQFACEFDRPDLGSVDATVNVTVSVPPAGKQVVLNGRAVCGVPTSKAHLQDYVYFNVINVSFNCTSASSPYTEFFGDFSAGKCDPTLVPDITKLVTGQFVALDSPVGAGTLTKNALIAACGKVAGCTINVGVEDMTVKNFSKVCQGGQILNFATNTVDGEIRPGKVLACYCNSHFAPFPGGPVDCGSGSNIAPQTVNTNGAVSCEFDWRKTTDTINHNGSPNQVPVAIYDSPTCPVDDIVQSTVKVCGGVSPRSLGVQTVSGRKALVGQVSEGDCVSSVTLGPVGTQFDIFVQGQFNDGLPVGSLNPGTQLTGFDTVTVQ